MKTIFYIAFLVLLTTACGSKEEKVVDMNHIIPHSERDYDHNDSDTIADDSTLVPLAEFNRFGIDAISVRFIEKKQFPDRVGPKSSERFQLNMDSDTLEYYIWQFEDSSRVMNAFYNWMDVFDVEQIGANVRIEKKALNLFVGDTTIVYISGNTIDNNKWISYFDSLGYDSNWNFIVDQKKGRKAKWFTFDEDEKVEFKINE